MCSVMSHSHTRFPDYNTNPYSCSFVHERYDRLNFYKTDGSDGNSTVVKTQ